MKDLIIINNEKVFNENGDFFCDNLDLKILPEGLNDYYRVQYIVRSSSTKKDQKINLNNIKTGSNILIGRQALLNINFIDMTDMYSFERSAIITTCCGEALNKTFDYPSHFICHIATLARALQIPTIKGFLYNVL